MNRKVFQDYLAIEDLEPYTLYEVMARTYTDRPVQIGYWVGEYFVGPAFGHGQHYLEIERHWDDNDCGTVKPIRKYHGKEPDWFEDAKFKCPKVVFPKEQIDESMGHVVHRMYCDCMAGFERDTWMMIPILNGGVYFYVDLARRLQKDKHFNHEMGIIATSHYGEHEVPHEEVQFKFIDADVKDRRVILVDEICFTGKTLLAAKEACLERGARVVKTVVLVDHIRDGRVYEPDWGVVKYTGDAWLYGYGMDLRNIRREFTDILE